MTAVARTGEEAFRIVPCDENGDPVEPLGAMSAALREACLASAELYRKIGFRPPWVSYVALSDGAPVGGGAFVGAPVDGRVEIAYFTLEGHEGRGHATNTAVHLCRIAREAMPGLTIVANTLPEDNASTAILRKLGFARSGTTRDADVGEAWQWRIEP